LPIVSTPCLLPLDVRLNASGQRNFFALVTLIGGQRRMAADADKLHRCKAERTQADPPDVACTLQPHHAIVAVSWVDPAIYARRFTLPILANSVREECDDARLDSRHYSQSRCTLEKAKWFNGPMVHQRRPTRRWYMFTA
jgi:hypothetical protein